MGSNNPHRSPSQQLTLSLEPGVSQRHRTLRDCVAAGVYRTGLTRVAGQVDESPSKLSEKLAGGGADRKRDVGLELFEAYLDKTGDREPIYYLIDKYLRDPKAQQHELQARIAGMLEQLPGLLKQAGMAR